MHAKLFILAQIVNVPQTYTISRSHYCIHKERTRHLLLGGNNTLSVCVSVSLCLSVYAQWVIQNLLFFRFDWQQIWGLLYILA